MEFLSNAVDSVTNFLGDTITSGVEAVLYNTVYKLLYYVASALCWFLGIIYDMFSVFAGIDQVSYDGEKSYLIDVFFNNTSISNIYWAMALIGIALCFGFTILTVARKTADMGERVKGSFGTILTQAFKSIILILAMSAIITMVLNATTVLMQRVNYAFSNADTLTQEETIRFDDEEYAAMARVLNTIGNYSLNPSSNSHYNLHSCYNEIRGDMQYLQERGVFDFYYQTRDENGNEVVTWQSALQKLAKAGDLTQDLTMDYYNSAVSNSLLEIMDILRTNTDFHPLSSYQRQYTGSGEDVPLEVLVYLMGTTQAARNSEFNQDPAMTDPVRGPYYTGQKSIHDFDAVSSDFDIGMATNYLIIYIVCFFLIKNLLVIIFNCVARIFNMLMLYVIFPPIAAASPADDGGKLKQWTTAFIVQSLSVFGTVVAMRLLLLYIPIIIDTRLQLFDSPTLNMIGKVILIMGGIECVKRASGIVTGILADNAGMQALQGGDMRGYAARQFGRMGSSARAVAGVGMTAAGMAGGLGWSAAKAAGRGAGAVARGAGAAIKAVTPKSVRSGLAAAKSILTNDANAAAYKRDLARMFGGSGGGQDAGSPGGSVPQSTDMPRQAAQQNSGAQSIPGAAARQEGDAASSGAGQMPGGAASVRSGGQEQPQTRPRSNAVHNRRPPDDRQAFLNSLR